MTIADIFQSMDYGSAPESTTSAEDWLDRRDRTLRPFIGGAFREPAGRAYFDSFNPATGTRLYGAAQCGAVDVDAAVGAARAAQPSWASLGGHGRARYLYALARHVQKEARLLAVLETQDNGKPVRETRDVDIPLVARHFYHHAGWSQLLDRELDDYAPLGVAGQIIPWNFPLLMLAWKIAPALATGNTVVLKPAEYTSATAIAFAELCERIDLPPGVVNVVTGDGSTGALIVQHPDVDKIAFTGSTDVGRLIRNATAGSGKKLSLELGGKSPFLVFEDADLDSAVEGVVDAIWFNQGEVCCAGSRLLVQEGIAGDFNARLQRRMETLRVGDPTDKSVDIGAVVSPAQLERIEALVQQGVAEGATLWQPSTKLPARGCFHLPTLFTDVAPSATIAQVEIFGPVLVAMTFRTPQEAVQLANDTRYGLAASVWTESLDIALDVATQVKAGTVWVNSTNQFDAAAGFGGYRESGFGREGGLEGLWEYLQPRWTVAARRDGPTPGPSSDAPARKPPPVSSVDRTAKLYVGGRQVRPDGGGCRPVHDALGRRLAEVGEGGRKDVRNAVEAARKAEGWARESAHLRAQVLYYVAENLAARSAEFGARLASMDERAEEACAREVEIAVARLFTCAAWADKYDGRVHSTAARQFTLAVHEPVGTVGILCPDAWPLLAFCSAVFSAVAMGSTVVVVPSPARPLAATDFYQVLDTSDVPPGVVNVVTGERDPLAAVLAAHDDLDAVWYFGPRAGGAEVERASCGNLKRTWVEDEHLRRWDDPRQGAGPELLRHATQVKNIWVPYGA